MPHDQKLVVPKQVIQQDLGLNPEHRSTEQTGLADRRSNEPSKVVHDINYVSLPLFQGLSV